MLQTHQENELQGKVSLIAEPGQDYFYLPGLHQANNIAKKTQLVTGDFTFRAFCKHDGKSKFDAAGLCLEVYDTIDQISSRPIAQLKFGVENFGECKKPRVVTVLTQKFSDEVAGRELEEQSAELVLTRNGSIISCYSLKKSSQKTSQLRFERALNLEFSHAVIFVGIFTQAPISQFQVNAEFDIESIANTAIPHIRE